MSLTFRRAPAFIGGGNAQKITSTEHVQLADSYNDRMESGLGDPTYRIHQYLYNLTRQPRRPVENLWPAQGEFWHSLVHVSPGSGSWPEGEPGYDPGAANTASPAMAFVLGNPSVASEAARFIDVPILANSNEPQFLWELGKVQRGGYDPDTGDYSAPMFSAAQDFYRIGQPYWSPMGKSYGGYQPVPEISGTCNDDNQSPYYRIKFTSLEDGSVLEWDSACTESTGKRVVYINYAPFAYYVYFADGTYTRIDRKTYIEGPYEGGGRLRKPAGEQIARLLLAAFCHDFRGASYQRLGQFDIQKITFHFQQFYERQYLLAPAKGISTAGDVDVSYPTFTFATYSVGSTTGEYDITPGFVCAAIFIAATHVRTAATIQALDNGVVFDTFSAGSDSIRTYADAKRRTLQFRIATAPVLEAGGSIILEVAELLDYKPELHDAYAVLRASSSKGGTIQTLDEVGRDVDYARSIFDYYCANGCIGNVHGATSLYEQLEEVNSNPVFDAFRRLAGQWIRIIPRSAFVDYEVANGKSVLYFKQYAYVSGATCDLFDGIYPIATVAPPGGLTNEWLMFIQTKVGTDEDNEANLFKPSAYGDWLDFNERCHFYSADITPSTKPDMLAHFGWYPNTNFAPNRLLFAESPTGYRYAQGTNRNNRQVTDDDFLCFLKSCRIYEPDLNVESAEAVTEDGESRIKVTLSSRLRYCETAPVSISRGVSTWDTDALYAERWRSDENALREYLAWQANVGYYPSWKIGDAALGVSQGDLPYHAFGSILPSFHFTKKVTKPYVDDNDTVEVQSDTRVDADRFAQMECYLRAMSEGYVDGITSMDYGCRTGIASLFDFTFENLCYQANGSRWITTLDRSVRNDEPQGFGPLPCVKISADGLNQIANCLNLMTTVRMPLPYILQSKVRQYSGSGSASPDWPSGATCDSGNQKAVFLNATIPSPGTLVSEDPDFSDVSPGEGIAALVGGGVSEDCDGTSYVTVSQKMTTDFRLKFDPRFLTAIPDDILNLINTSFVGFIGKWTKITSTTKATVISTELQATSCKNPEEPDNYWFWDAGTSTGYKMETNLAIDGPVCMMLFSGTLDAGNPPITDMAFCRTSTLAGLGMSGGVSIGIDVSGDNDVAWVVVPLE